MGFTPMKLNETYELNESQREWVQHNFSQMSRQVEGKVNKIFLTIDSTRMLLGGEKTYVLNIITGLATRCEISGRNVSWRQLDLMGSIGVMSMTPSELSNELFHELQGKIRNL